MSSRSSPCQLALATVVVLVAFAPLHAVAQAPMQGQMQQTMAQRAQMRERPEVVMRGSQRGDERSLSDAVRRVQRSTGGHILGAERVPFDGRDINRVKYMDERGRVRYMDDPVQQRSQARPPRSDMSSLRGDNP
ncbi:MAG: hypothetical protein QHC77_05935 [Stenotrophomonas sp.]|jgi:hypothetical protein|uniref:hypothetical protein n=1 Tax=Stenotrophomonas TaxID=40323 RepID=UPI0005AF1AA2|nr:MULTISPECIES: hypothetical protein [unclassified Stenotrophomonas]KIP86193.1 hypothetical protein SN15_09110 [Stenotrophomonas maltophilia]MBD8644648.1 hypothetical protein [Stenotrophomonas sp. CFBP 13724]MDX3931458.1 hypothetical protein [Stenotrophomonas sp.]MDY1035102.1 hypothetical protein [Stenotrophomonas sp. CFBP8980]PKH72028.1 hypothetical protein CXF90_09270 [Stenotrophomonas sp. Betaine-02u-23]